MVRQLGVRRKATIGGGSAMVTRFGKGCVSQVGHPRYIV
jgi:hypothetical protein